MKIISTITVLLLFLLMGCKNDQVDLRPSMKEIVKGHNYSITASDSNGQVIIIENTSASEIGNILRAAGGTATINGEEHSVWKKGKVVYQFIQSGKNVEAVVLDNPPKK